MPDYAHELVFGSFVTPSSADPEQVVALAQTSERLGLDLVTFQDHPYQPALLDAWTLLSYVAAATVEIRLAPNVLNLPLRNPAVVARSAASLDLLSGGRVELGLGAGAFWDGIAAMGGARRTPGESVGALAEAIEVIRAVWDTDTRGGVHVRGRHYHVDGARRGPAPAHRIELWVGAYKPRLLRLTGRLADGWLPSMGYLDPDGLPAGNRAIDEAAAASGREPGDVRRLYNISGRFRTDTRGFLQGPPDVWAEQLAELALTQGVSTFILAADDPETLGIFATDVAPSVRSAVAAGRARPGALDATPAAAPSSVPTPLGTGTGGGRPFNVRPTRDDGRRLSSERVWDETTRPSLPAPDGHRTYRPAELASGQHLIDIHDHFRRELTQLRGMIGQVVGGQLDPSAARSAIAEMTIRQNEWTIGAYCASYCRMVTTHHTLEDQAMFPRLRSGDRRLAPVIDRLEDEHRVIHDVLERVDRALVAFVDAPQSPSPLTGAVDLLSDVLLSHLSYEERELVEPLARLGILV